MIPLFILFDFLDWIKETYNNPETLIFLQGLWNGLFSILRFAFFMAEVLFYAIQDPVYFLMGGLAFILIFALGARSIKNWWRSIFRGANSFYEGFSSKFERLYNMSLGLLTFIRNLFRL